MTIERHGWRMVRFTGPGDSPAYVDLRYVAAVVDADDPNGKGELGVARGAKIVLTSGCVVHVRETAETVFEEVHRYNTEEEPAKKPTKLSGSSPAAGDTSTIPGPES